MTDHLRHRKRRSIYLFDTDHSQIDAEAKSQGQSFSSYVVECAISKKAPDPDTKKNLLALYVELGRIGNNLNQIARSFNQQNADYEELAQQLPEALHLLKELRQELSK